MQAGYVTRLMPGDRRFGRDLALQLGEADELKREFRAQIQEHAARELNDDDFIVRGCLLCNSARDYYYSRFTKGALNEIAELLPSAPVLRSHNHMGEAIGRFFKADVVRIDQPGVPKADSDWVKALYYVPTDNEGKRHANRVDLGIDKEVSIGWRCVRSNCSECGLNIGECVHIPGDIYEKGIAEYRFSGITATLEGSHVPRGGQKDTTSFVPDASGQMMRSAFAVDSDDIEWDRIIATKRANQTTEQFLSGGQVERAVGFGALFGKQGDRVNAQQLIMSKERFSSVASAARWVRDHDFAADMRSETNSAYVFNQFADALAVPGSGKQRKLDPGVSALIVKRQNPQQQDDRERNMTTEELLRAGSLVSLSTET